MKLSMGMKVGLVSLFSCLALLLGLLSSAGMASAHTATTLQTTHVSVATVADDRGRGDFGRGGRDFDPNGSIPIFPSTNPSTVTWGQCVPASANDNPCPPDPAPAGIPYHRP